MSVSLLLRGWGRSFMCSLSRLLSFLSLRVFFFFFLLSPCWLKNVIDILSASSHLPFYFILLVLYHLSSLTQNSCRRIPFLKVFFSPSLRLVLSPMLLLLLDPRLPPSSPFASLLCCLLLTNFACHGLYFMHHDCPTFHCSTRYALHVSPTRRRRPFLFVSSKISV